MAFDKGFTEPKQVWSKTLLMWHDAESGELIVFRFDAVTTETKDDSVDITDHPVEVGSNISDNARDAPALLTLEGIVSGIPSDMLDDDASIINQTITVNGMSAPGTQQVLLDIPAVPLALSESGLIQAGIGAIKGLFAGAPKATVTGDPLLAQYSTQANLLVQDSSRNRGRDAYEMFLLLKRQHIVLSHLVTAFRDYDDMMISRLSQPRAVGDGTSAKFQIDFKQVRLVSTTSVAAPKPAPVPAQPKHKEGAKPTEPNPKGESGEHALKRHAKEAAKAARDGIAT